MKNIFDSYDEEKKQKLNFEEFRTFIEDLGLFQIKQQQTESNSESFEELIDDLWNKFDINGDSFISFEEFVHMYNILIIG